MRPNYKTRNFFRFYQTVVAVHAGDSASDFIIVTQMRLQHFSIGKAGTNKGGVNATPHQILTAGSHHAQQGMLGYDVAQGAGYGFL